MNIEIAKLVLPAVAFLWGMYEYKVTVEVRKIDRVQEYIGKYVEITDVKTAVEGFWAQHKNDKTINFEWDPKEPNKYTEATYKIVVELIENDNELRKNVHHLQNFYYNVAVCLNDGLCDLDTTCDAFFGDVSEYVNIHIGYLKQFANLWLIDKHTQMETLMQTCELRQTQKQQR